MRYLYFASFAAISLTLSACVRQSCGMVKADVVDQCYVHKYGVAVPPDFWESSGAHGAVVSTMGDGVVIARSYSSGLLEGETSYSFPHSSQMQKKEIYQQGKLIKIVELNMDGTPHTEVSFDTPAPGMNVFSTWYLSGTPKSIEQFNGGSLFSGEYFNLNNSREATVDNYEGIRLLRDDYGQLIATDTIQGGMLTMRTTYHQNGAPREMIPYQDGLVHGSKRTFHPAGEPNTIEQWAYGYQDGDSFLYLHGEKYAEVPYKQNLRKGVEYRYRDGTQVVQEISWDNDQMHGPTKTYVGGTSKTEWYYQGNPTTEANYDFMVNRPVVR